MKWKLFYHSNGADDCLCIDASEAIDKEKLKALAKKDHERKRVTFGNADVHICELETDEGIIYLD